MNCFLLLFVSSMFTGITGIALPPRGLSDPLLQESPDNSLWLASEDTIDFNSDPLLFAENSGIASFPPIVFDEASAVACDNTQSSLDPNTELFGLDARDLIDEFTGVQDLVAPLQQLPNSQCSAFTGQQQGPKQGAQRQTPVTDSPPETSIQQQQRVRLAPGICPLDYHYPLCCSGIVIGSNVLSCAVCECFQTSDHRASSILSSSCSLWNDP